MRQTKHKVQGLSLIEVLVATLIVAVGILGVAGMQVVSLQQNRNALLRDQALQLGNDILDRMRANPLTDYSPIDIAAEPSSNVNCVTNSCDRNEMKTYDVAQWKCSINPINSSNEVYPVCTGFGIVDGALPGGRGGIGKVEGVPEITVEWINDRDGNTSSIVLRTQTEDI